MEKFSSKIYFNNIALRETKNPGLLDKGFLLISEFAILL